MPGLSRHFTDTKEVTAMKCPKCKGPLRISKKDPSYALCDTCRKKFRISDAPKHPPMKRRKKRKRGKLLGLLILLILASAAVFLFLRYVRNSSSDDAGHISPDQFETIKTGMTYQEVADITGSEGRKVSSYKTDGINMDIYEWISSEGNGNVLITFQEEKVSGKAQAGLTETATAFLDKDLFESISTDMSYEKVRDLIGCDGELISLSQTSSVSFSVYAWHTKDDTASICVTFQDDTVTYKSQSGLK